jgi:hypothetical protein
LFSPQFGKVAEIYVQTFGESFRNTSLYEFYNFPYNFFEDFIPLFLMQMSSGRAEPREVNAVCVDVIFYLFICPAMVDPNPVGIIDTPISYIARSNLMQVKRHFIDELSKEKRNLHHFYLSSTFDCLFRLLKFCKF